MKTLRFVLPVAVVLAAQGLVWGQSTITFNGSVPQTFSILDSSDAALALTDTSFTSAIGKNLLTEATKVIHLRSNDVYKLSASVGGLSNIGTGVGAVEGKTAAAIQIGDIGFGISAIDATGNSVVKTGSGQGTRTDTVVTVPTTGPDFNYVSKTAVDGRMTTNKWAATLHDVASATQVLSGDRISASGDNSSDDNFLAVSLKFGYLPQYFTVESAFTFVVTLTMAQGGA